MNKDAIWGVLVLILVASLAAAVIDRDGTTVPPEPSVNAEESEEQTLNPTPPIHDDGHLHPAPILSLISAEDDGAVISLSGFVIHSHPSEILVDVVFEEESIAQFAPDASGLWNFTVTTDASGVVSLNFTAAHGLENTTSEPMVVDVDRTEEEQGSTGEGQANETQGNSSTGNSSDNSTGNQTDNSTDNGTGNSTDNGTGDGASNGTGNETQPPAGPTYNASDLGQFWLDVFRCQPGQNITQVDDLTNTAVATH